MSLKKGHIILAARHGLIILFIGIFSFSCDSVPGLDEDIGSPPQIENFDFSPSEVVFENLPPGQIVNGTIARIPLNLSANILDPEENISDVSFFVRSPIPPFEKIAEGKLIGAGSGNYSTVSEVEIPKGSTGKYAVVIFASDANGLLSNQARASLNFQVEGGEPPVLLSIAAPDTVFRPSAEDPPVLVGIVAEAIDPDGLDNIAKVVLRTFDNQEFPLRDDGGAGGSNSGDVEADDGLFTITIQVASTNALGPNTFKFQATDRSGLVSNILEKTITIAR